MPAICSKRFKAGDIIFESKPLFFCLKDEYQIINCNNCLKSSESLKRCGKCHQMYYCNKSCQINDWKYHKNECKLFKSEKSLVPFYIRYLLRLWLCVKTDPEFGERRHQLFDGSDVCINEIKVEVEKVLKLMENDVKEEIRFDLICQFFRYHGIDFNRKELLHWFGFIKLPFNTSIMYYNKNQLITFESIMIPIGRGLYIQLVNTSHSCVSNSGLTKNGLSLELRAMKSIISGEQITNTYIDLGHNKLERKMILDQILEDCHCDRCQLDLDKDWDYNRYTKLFGINLQYLIEIDNHLMSHMSAGYLIDNQFFEYSRLFYGENNPQLNELILLCFICFAYHSKLSNPLTLTHWYELLKKSMDITHGSDHPLNEMLSIVYYNSI